MMNTYEDYLELLQAAEKEIKKSPKSAPTPVPQKPTTQSSDYSSSSMGTDKMIKFVADTAAIVGGTVWLGIPGLLGGVTVAIFANELIDKTKKYSVCRTNETKTITEVQTPETQLIEKYNARLETAIEKLLKNKPGNNYELEIAKLKYANQIHLLEARIETKLNKAKKTGVVHTLEIAALSGQLKRAQKKFDKLASYTPSDDKDYKLTKLDDKIEGLEQKLELNGGGSKISELRSKIKLIKYNKKRLQLIDKLVLNKDLIAQKHLFYARFTSLFTGRGYVEEENKFGNVRGK